VYLVLLLSLSLVLCFGKELWTNDTWMILKPNEGWPPEAYDNGTLVQQRIQ
jgi:hypothetical protein